jgi:hypothetical protein
MVVRLEQSCDDGRRPLIGASLSGLRHAVCHARMPQRLQSSKLAVPSAILRKEPWDAWINCPASVLLILFDHMLRAFHSRCCCPPNHFRGCVL